jgi:hypothetical protein
VEEFIAEFEGPKQDHTRWSEQFSDERRVAQEMLEKANVGFQKWLAGT